MTTAYISHPDCLHHLNGMNHPECPERLQAIEQALKAQGLYEKLVHFDAIRAKKKHLLRVHDAEYIDFVHSVAPKDGFVQLDPDTTMNAYTLNAALSAAGALVLATDLVCRGKVDNAFCSIRPPGHHAEHNQAMGFCFFNNIAIGVAHALEHYQLKRIAIIDFDVHHGNGTEDIFLNEERVLLCSTFQHPLYPYSHTHSGNAHIIKLPLNANTSSEVYRETVTKQLFPRLEDFKPEMIYISAGFDAHQDDPISHMGLQESDYEWLAKHIIRIANCHSHGRIVASLEGGYALNALGASAGAFINCLINK